MSKTNVGKLVSVCVWTAFLPLPAAAQPPQLRPAQLIGAEGGPLQPGIFSIPFVTDWNGDGRKDLLVGYQPVSKLALFLNTGTDAQPVFTSFANVQAGGQDIYHPSGGCGAPAPWVIDFDHDGKRDLLIGAGHDGKVWFYRNTNANPAAAPMLAPGALIQVGTNTPAGVTNLSVGSRAIPCVYDWDADGLEDLICGSGGSTAGSISSWYSFVYFFKNTNTAQAPVFAPGRIVQAGGANLQTAIRSTPRVFDWNNDGLVDLVCSTDTNVFWCRNINTNKNQAPVLLAAQDIRAPFASGLVPINTPGAASGNRMRVFPTDWNNDQVTDLLVGDNNGTVSFFQGYTFALRPPAFRSTGELVLQWTSCSNLSYRIEATNNLANSNWAVLATNVSATGLSTTWTNTCAGNCLFYRVVLPEK